MPWNLTGTTATLQQAEAVGQIDLLKPSSGMKIKLLKQGEVNGSFAAWQPNAGGQAPLPLLDHYIRGNDLVAVYGPVEDFPFETEIYWRALPLLDGVQLRLSVIVSVETSLLDTQPEILVRTAWPSATRSTSTEFPGTLYRDAADAYSYWEALAPSDQVSEETASEVAATEEGTHLLFSHFLEKGVIRRAMLTTALLDRDHDQQSSQLCYEDFLSRPLPLTT